MHYSETEKWFLTHLIIGIYNGGILTPVTSGHSPCLFLFLFHLFFWGGGEGDGMKYCLVTNYIAIKKIIRIFPIRTQNDIRNYVKSWHFLLLQLYTFALDLGKLSQLVLFNVDNAHVWCLRFNKVGFMPTSFEEYC